MIEVALTLFIESTSLIETTSTITDCRDPDDNRVLECAVDGPADIIITGDKDLLVLHPFRGIRILTPRQFLDDYAPAAHPLP